MTIVVNPAFPPAFLCMLHIGSKVHCVQHTLGVICANSSGSVVVRSSGKAFITSPAGVEEVCGYGILLLVNLSVECGSGVWHKYACAINCMV